MIVHDHHLLHTVLYCTFLRTPTAHDYTTSIRYYTPPRRRSFDFAADGCTAASGGTAIVVGPPANDPHRAARTVSWPPDTVGTLVTAIRSHIAHARLPRAAHGELHLSYVGIPPPAAPRARASWKSRARHSFRAFAFPLSRTDEFIARFVKVVELRPSYSSNVASVQ